MSYWYDSAHGKRTELFVLYNRWLPGCSYQRIAKHKYWFFILGDGCEVIPVFYHISRWEYSIKPWVQSLRQPAGTTYIPSSRLYAYGPTAVNTIRNDGCFVSVCKSLIFKKKWILFGCLDEFRSVIWLDFIRLFGNFPAGSFPEDRYSIPGVGLAFQKIYL